MTDAAKALLELLSKHTHGSDSEHEEMAEEFVSAMTAEARRPRLEAQASPHGQPHYFINAKCKYCGAKSTDDPVACKREAGND